MDTIINKTQLVVAVVAVYLSLFWRNHLNINLFSSTLHAGAYLLMQSCKHTYAHTHTYTHTHTHTHWYCTNIRVKVFALTSATRWSQTYLSSGEVPCTSRLLYDNISSVWTLSRVYNLGERILWDLWLYLVHYVFLFFRTSLSVTIGRHCFNFIGPV